MMIEHQSSLTKGHTCLWAACPGLTTNTCNCTSRGLRRTDAPAKHCKPDTYCRERLFVAGFHEPTNIHIMCSRLSHRLVESSVEIANLQLMTHCPEQLRHHHSAGHLLLLAVVRMMGHQNHRAYLPRWMVRFVHWHLDSL